ncbi:unnamed protein product [Cochlearia groenlandica]
MKFTGKSNPIPTLSNTGPNLEEATVKPRKLKPSLIRHRRSVFSGRRRSRPETPLSKPKPEDQIKDRFSTVEEEDDDDCSNRISKFSTTIHRHERRDTVRKLAAGVWRLQVSDAVSSGGGDKKRSNDVLLGFQGSVGHAEHLGPLFYYSHGHRHFGFQSNKIRDKSSSVDSTECGFLCKDEPSIPFSYWAMEGATKWDPTSLDTRGEAHQIYSKAKQINEEVNVVSLVSSIELKLKEALARIQDLESEKRSQKKKLEQFLKKVSEERVAWRCKEHEKVQAVIDDMKADMNQERKTRQRLETDNLKLVNELADLKLAVKRSIHDYQKERKAREVMEEVCDELVKEIEEDKSEIEAMKSDSMNLREEVDDERRMLQMAEVWREERVQMKLIDAKVTLEEKYSQMNKLVGDLEAFLRSRNASTCVIEAEALRETVASVNNVQEIKEFTYEPAKPEDIFMLFEEMNLEEAHDRDIEQRVSSDINLVNKERHSNAFTDQNGEFEEDDSGWETVSHPEEHGSVSSQDESIPSITNNHQRDSNVSMMNGTEFQKTPLREIKELSSLPRRDSKKVSSMTKLWSSLEGMNGRVSNGRKSSASMVSPVRSSRKGRFNALDLAGQWSSSPDSAHANVNRGAMKGCIEWPRGSAHKNSMKTKLVETQTESQKIQLKHVLEHKI